MVRLLSPTSVQSLPFQVGFWFSAWVLFGVFFLFLDWTLVLLEKPVFPNDCYMMPGFGSL